MELQNAYLPTSDRNKRNIWPNGHICGLLKGRRSVPNEAERARFLVLRNQITEWLPASRIWCTHRLSACHSHEERTIGLDDAIAAKLAAISAVDVHLTVTEKVAVDDEAEDPTRLGAVAIAGRAVGPVCWVVYQKLAERSCAHIRLDRRKGAAGQENERPDGEGGEGRVLVTVIVEEAGGKRKRDGWVDS